MKVIKKDTKILFSSKEVLSNGYPLPTTVNKYSVRILRDFIAEKQISNLVLFGQSVEDNIFFIPDILKHAYKVFSDHRLIR